MSSSSQIEVGMTVVTHALKKEEFNGKTGIVKKFKNGRVIVSLKDSNGKYKDCALREENIKKAREGTDGKNRIKRRKRSTSSSSRSSSSYTKSYSSSGESSASEEEGSSKSPASWVKVIPQYPSDHTRREEYPVDPVSVIDIFWLFTQFAKVKTIIEHPRKFLVELQDSVQDVLHYFKHVDLDFTNGRFTIKCFVTNLTDLNCEIPGIKRDFSKVNNILQELLLTTSTDDAAEGLEIMFKNSQWSGPRDFVWTHWVSGKGWLHPKQPQEFFQRMPSKIKWSKELVHFGSLWEGCSAVDIFRLASMYGDVEGVLPRSQYKNKVQTPSWCVVKFKSVSGAQAAMNNLDGIQIGSKKLRVDQYTGELKSNSGLVRGPADSRFKTASFITFPSTRIYMPLSGSEEDDFVASSIRSAYRVEAFPLKSGIAIDFKNIADAVIFVSKHNGEKWRGCALAMEFVDI
eukprot:TRINITY_DN3438_c1_g1_i1.p1 TRINITY_DN3438_c1_g1~~TRINITY_DN3438_c1_g1_i1.p1  ORF type:complete len:458 (+),score=54.42 TRINITY_DN3438_c1_g1_i1:143-1516(+)